jgi:hypothetical protein
MELVPDRYATIRNVYLHYRRIEVATLGNNAGKIRSVSAQPPCRRLLLSILVICNLLATEFRDGKRMAKKILE